MMSKKPASMRIIDGGSMHENNDTKDRQRYSGLSFFLLN